MNSTNPPDRSPKESLPDASPSNPSPGNVGSSRGRFATTSWSLVVQAIDGHSSEARTALESLCQTYWYPLYAFVRRKGNSANQAEDLTQGFFVHLLEKESLQSVSQERGKFRSFLLTSLNNFLHNQWRKRSAEKRGGSKKILSIDFDAGEKRYVNEPFHDLTAEKIFEHSWAMTVLSRTFDELAAKYADSGKSEIYEALKTYLAGDGEGTYADAAERLGMTVGSIKVAVHRMRKTCREILRSKIRETLESSDDIESEIDELFESVQAF